jgi:protein-tyrosine phosphatase
MVVTELPYMRGSAVHARGAGEFNVPLFSHIKDNLWMGCSPSEFPDELEGLDPNSLEWFVKAEKLKRIATDCRHLVQWDSILLRDEPRFTRILNLYQWGEYKVPEGTEMVVEEMYDQYGEVDVEQLERLVALVQGWLKGGHRVLVHCQAGLNRSSLVVARVLMVEYGMSAGQAINYIRDNRSPTCLCNKDFEEYLWRLDSE